MSGVDKFLDLKRNLAWKLCTELLDQPLPPPPNAPEQLSNESESEKRRKQREYEIKLQSYEEHRQRSEVVLLAKLDSFIENMKASQHKTPIDNAEVWLSRSVVGEAQAMQLRCQLCGNNDSTYFLHDGSSGDTICLGVGGAGCGNIVVDHVVDEGAQFRRFSDDEGEDRNHYGPSLDPLMPDSENLRTRIAYSGSGTKAEVKRLSQTSQHIEMNLSNIGNNDRRTRTGYRTNMKRDAFDLMVHVAANLNIHAAVTTKAKEIFARHRDVVERLQKYNVCVAACLIIAMESILEEERKNTDALFNKRSYLSSSFVSTANSLNNNAVSATGGTPKLLESSDPIITMHKPALTGAWNREQVQQWLGIVFGDINCTSIQIVLGALENKISSSKPRDNKRKSSSSIFGTTTMANRNKKYISSANSNNTLTFGQALVLLAVDELQIETEDKLKLKSALRLRHNYETLLAEQKHNIELQTRRLNAETASRLPQAPAPVSDAADMALIPAAPPVDAGDDDLITSVLRVASEIQPSIKEEEEDESYNKSKKPKHNRGANIQFAVVEG